MMKEYFTTFYLDKERDIVVNLYKTGEDELTYIIETPNHSTGNLITNLAKISGKEITRNEQGLKIVEGTIVGEHEVFFAGEDEVIEFKHTAYSKAIFGKGAVEAGKISIEGKEYIVQDGDIMHFRFNV